jgi:DNA-binding IclR family transcriptional regulator
MDSTPSACDHGGVGVGLCVREGDEPGDTGRTVLGRIAAIMDVFDRGETVLTLNDLSRRAGLPKSTVHRLIEQLRSLGWLERDHQNGYRIGMRLFELGGLALEPNHLRDTAFPHLYALAARTGLAVQLAVLDRGEVVYLERVLLGGFRLPTRLGGRMPAHCTALGKAMLAFDPSATEMVLASGLPRRTPFTITEPAELRAHLEQAHATGIAYDRRESYDGLGCVAAPIRNSGRAIAAVSVTGPVTRLDWDATTDAVKNTAVNIWNDRFATVRGSRSTGELGRCQSSNHPPSPTGSAINAR